MKFRITYEVEINSNVGSAYFGIELRRHLEEIDAENDMLAIKLAESKKSEVIRKYNSAVRCYIKDIDVEKNAA